MTSLFKTIGWGLFCTSSWTWCIGMWLPLLLIDRWGWPGFWLFAIPNVIGCAAMGYVVGSRERSIGLVAANRGAMRLFSIVTIAFQLFWLTSLAGQPGFIPFISDQQTAAIVVPFAVLGAGMLVSALPVTGWLIAAALLFAWTMASFGLLPSNSMEQIGTSGTIPSSQLWGAAPIIVLGFLLSPYLDLTFHKARQQTPSSHSFAIFGITFMAVLLFVASYWQKSPIATSGIVVIFWLLQLTFTIGAHLRELVQTETKSTSRNYIWVVMAPIPAAWIVYYCTDTETAGTWLLNDTYLRFLGFYGLAVPIWVLAFMWPRPAARTKSVAIVLGITLCIAFALAELGMVRTPTWWLLPAASLAVVVPLVIARRCPAGGS
ncbi:MAG: hypothetical protein P8K80_02045 [Phycisphaerales bacterium]|nr:hypothetical protein [Phycisphaerales bacterium]